jgi:hypothetical protein
MGLGVTCECKFGRTTRAFCFLLPLVYERR